MDMALAATGAIRGSSREKLYQKLGLEALYHRRWFHNLWFTKLIKTNVLVSYTNYCSKVADFDKRDTVLIYRIYVLNIFSL